MKEVVVICHSIRGPKQFKLAYLTKAVFCLLMVLLTSLDSFSQTETLPAPINEITVNAISSGLGSLLEKEAVGKGSETEFTVSAVIDGVGLAENNEFHWIVYGGTIVSVTGGTMEGVVKTYSDAGNQVSEVVAKGWKDGESSINIKWQNTDSERAFIAVRQTSEYGCSDDIYSIYYVNVTNAFIELDVVPEAEDCAMASENFVSYDLTISNHKLEGSWKFKYMIRTKEGSGEWSEWLPGLYNAENSESDPNYGYVVIPAGSGNDKYTLDIPISDNKVKGSGDLKTEIKITDVRDANNSTVESLPTNYFSVILHKIPLTNFNITADD